MVSYDQIVGSISVALSDDGGEGGGVFGSALQLDTLGSGLGTDHLNLSGTIGIAGLVGSSGDDVFDLTVATGADTGVLLDPTFHTLAGGGGHDTLVLDAGTYSAGDFRVVSGVAVLEFVQQEGKTPIYLTGGAQLAAAGFSTIDLTADDGRGAYIDLAGDTNAMTILVGQDDSVALNNGSAGLDTLRLGSDDIVNLSGDIIVAGSVTNGVPVTILGGGDDTFLLSGGTYGLSYFQNIFDFGDGTSDLVVTGTAGLNLSGGAALAGAGIGTIDLSLYDGPAATVNLVGDALAVDVIAGSASTALAISVGAGSGLDTLELAAGTYGSSYFQHISGMSDLVATGGDASVNLTPGTAFATIDLSGVYGYTSRST